MKWSHYIKKKKLIPLVADDEKAICNAIDKILPSVYRFRCWNHTINSVKVWLQGHGETPREIPVYVASMRELFHQASEAEYLAKLENLKKDLQYYEPEIHPEVQGNYKAHNVLHACNFVIFSGYHYHWTMDFGKIRSL